MQDEPSTIVVNDVVENEDGSATYTFNMDSRSNERVSGLGLELILTCAVYGFDIRDALNLIVEHGERIEG